MFVLCPLRLYFEPSITQKFLRKVVEKICIFEFHSVIDFHSRLHLILIYGNKCSTAERVTILRLSETFRSLHYWNREQPCYNIAALRECKILISCKPELRKRLFSLEQSVILIWLNKCLELIAAFLLSNNSTIFFD